MYWCKSSKCKRAQLLITQAGADKHWLGYLSVNSVLTQVRVLPRSLLTEEVQSTDYTVIGLKHEGRFGCFRIQDLV